MIVWALYGGKFARREFWCHLRSCMKHLEFESCLDDSDVWIHASTREYGTKYHEYVLLYVDNFLIISEKAKNILRKETGIYFELKEKSMGPLSLYLGRKMCQVVLENGSKAWAFGYEQHLKETLINVKKYISKKGEALPARAPTPVLNTYYLNIEISEDLGPQ